eukprot:scpid88024/ scgid26124/ 
MTSKWLVQLKNVFANDHVAVGLATAYGTLTQFFQAIYTGNQYTDEKDGGHAAQSIPMAEQSHLLESCAKPEIALDCVGLVLISIVYTIRHCSQPQDTSTGWVRWLRPVWFALYLLLSHNQPVACADAGDGVKVASLVQGIMLLVFFVLPSLVAHLPHQTDPVEAVEHDSCLDWLEDKCESNHRDVFIVTLYHAVVKFTQSADPDSCTSRDLWIVGVAFGVLVMLFKVSHFVTCLGTCSDRWSCPDTDECTSFWSVIFRTSLLIVYLLCTHSYPLSCKYGTDTTSARNAAWYQGSFLFALTAITSFVHLKKKK